MLPRKRLGTIEVKIGVHLYETELKNVETLSAKLTLSNKVAGRDTIVVDAADGALTAHVRVDAETVTGT